MLSTKKLRGCRVLGGKSGTHKVGKVERTVFHPQEARVIGYIVKRPDLLWMFKRKDRFLAFDFASIIDGRLIASARSDVWDEAALARLGVDFERCIIWDYMPVRTEDGSELGRVGDVSFDAVTGKVFSVSLSDGAAAKALIGICEIPVDLIEGYSSGYLVAKTGAAQVESTGGIAEKAGIASAKASKSVTIAGKKAGAAINDGAYALGTVVGKTQKKIEQKKVKKKAGEEAGEGLDIAGQEVQGDAQTQGPPSAGQESHMEEGAMKAANKLGRQLGKTKGMFASFADEYKKGASGDE